MCSRRSLSRGGIERNRLGAHGLAEGRGEEAGRDEVDTAADEALEVLFEGEEGEADDALGRELDEEVEVLAGPKRSGWVADPKAERRATP